MDTSAVLVLAVAGLSIGVVLAMLGGGGSVLAVPALLWVGGLDPRQATAGSLVVVLVAALTGIWGHSRGGRVRWRVGATIGLFGALGSVAGTRLNLVVDDEVLVLAFIVLLASVGSTFLWRSRSGAEIVPAVRAGWVPVLGGLAVGLLTGFLGVGGGFLAVPVLIVAAGLRMPEAVGTSLLLVAINAAIALAARGGHVDVPLAQLLPFAIAMAIGSRLGGDAAGRIAPHVLSRGFGALLVVVAVGLAATA